MRAASVPWRGVPWRRRAHLERAGPGDAAQPSAVICRIACSKASGGWPPLTVAVVEDDRRHRLDAHRPVFLLFRAHFVSVVAARQHAARLFGVQPDRGGRLDQHVVAAGILAVAVVGLQQRLLERELLALQAGPVQQPVGVEGVVDELARAEGEADAGAALADHGLGFGDLGRGAAVFCRGSRRWPRPADPSAGSVRRDAWRCGHRPRHPARQRLLQRGRPIAHRGQAISETKSILRGAGMVIPLWW